MFSATLIVLALSGQTPEPSSDPAALVEKLGSASYAEREATKSLESLGSKALPALRSALKANDLEVRTRAKAMINKIEGNLLIQESMVRLDFKDASLEEIVKSLSKQAGVNVGLGGMGPRQAGTNFASRRVTLSEAQPVAFWQAIDRLCEVGQLASQYQPINLGGQGMPQPGLVLSDQPDPLTLPRYSHGPFHFNVLTLSYYSYISFNASDRMRAQLHAGAGGTAGFARAKGARPPVEPLPAGASGPDEAGKTGDTPARRVQFQVQLQIIPEPRMTLDPAAHLQLLEAVDELGHSLLPDVSDDERAFRPLGMTGFVMGAGANLTAQLHRPETPGKLIKILRGTALVSVSAPRPDALVIPLEGALGKTFQNDDRRVVVKSIDTNQETRQTVIELLIDNLDDLFPVDPVNGPGPGAPVGKMARGMVRRPGVATSHSPVEVRTSGGQIAFSNTSVDWESGRVTLRVIPTPQWGEAKEIRISSIIRATAKIPFEFHDLPMP
jgi:hypothetical protein